MVLLDDSSPLIVGAACDVIGAIGRLKQLPIDESNKSSLVKKLLSISFNSATLSKVEFGKIIIQIVVLISMLVFQIRNKAIKCTGLISVGETTSRSKDIIKEYLEKTKHVCIFCFYILLHLYLFI